MQVAEVIFRDEPSVHNRKLTDFLQKNIKHIIVKGQIRFKFTIAETKDLRRLINRGIKRLPAMVIQDKHYIGVDDIAHELHARAKRSRVQAAVKSSEEQVNDYLNRELGVTIGEDGKFIIPDDDDFEDNSAKLASDLSREVDRRSKAMKGMDLSSMQNSRGENAERAQREPDVMLGDNHSAARQDNVEAGDAMTSLRNINPSADRRDDEMLQQLIEKMGGADDM